MSARDSSDSQPIHSIYENDPEMAEILDMFISELPARAASLNGYFHANDERNLRTLSHQLKGAGAGYGFAQISSAAANVEQLLVEKGSDAFSAQLAELQEHMDALLSICRRVTR